MSARAAATAETASQKRAPTRVRDRPAAREAREASWPARLALTTSVGFALIVVAFALGRSRALDDTSIDPIWIFWIGYLVIVVPVAWRQLSEEASRSERAALVVLAGVQLYLVKLAYSPFALTFPDEFSHEFNVMEIERTGHLFGSNPLLPVTASYPSLETIAQAISSVSGVGPFGAAIVTVGLARAIMMLALFLLYEGVTGSARLGGLAALLYAAHGNFLYFGAQFKYESIALPLALAAIAVVVRWQQSDEASERAGWAVFGGGAIVAVVAGHHLTSYALLGYLVGVSLVRSVLIRLWTPDRYDVASAWERMRNRLPSPWRFAAFTAVAIAFWLLFVASSTSGYLLEIFNNAFSALVETLERQEEPRELFTTSGGLRAPAWERLAAVGSVLLMAAALPIAVWRTWRNHRDNAHVVLLVLAAGAFLASFGLRFAPGAWEVGNRASEFLFVGMALAMSMAILVVADHRRFGRAAVIISLVAVSILFTGGTVAGWPHDVRLPQPYRIEAAGAELDPQGAAVADWVSEHVGAGRNVAAGDANRRFLVARGARFPYKNREGAVERLIEKPDFIGWVMARLSDVRYVVFDRRQVDGDNLRGYFFPLDLYGPDAFYPRAARSKFERVRGSERLVDTGDIRVYDFGTGGLDGDAPSR